MLGEVFGRDLLPGLEQCDAHAGFSQLLGRPAAGGTGAYDYGIEPLLGDGDLQHGS